MSIHDEIRSKRERDEADARFKRQVVKGPLLPTPVPALNTTPEPSQTPESVRALEQCIELQLRKADDYQNPNSTVAQADYYPRGCSTIHDIVHAKMLRMKSLLETMEADPSARPNYESLEDSAMDAINYLSFMVSWCRNKIPGQSEFADPLNRIKQ